MARKHEEAERCECMHVHDDMIEMVESQMPGEEELADLAEFFRVFGDTTRIRILYVLMCSEVCVCVI